MSTISPIIAGIDFSDSSPLVIRHAIHAASLTAAPVIAIHVIPSGHLADLLAFGREVGDSKEVEAAALAKLRALIEAEDASGNIQAEVCVGRPVDAISEAVRRHGAGLLVIAANDMTKKRLGTIASQCVRTAPCDVLVLRDWQGGDFSRIAVCTDFSGSSSRALERGAQLAKAHRAQLEIVHVTYPPSEDSWGATLEHRADSAVSYVNECRDRTKRRMEDFLAVHAASLDGVSHQGVILESALVASELTHWIGKEGVDLVALGTRGHSRIGGLLLGTNAERLMHDVPVSVLAVRDSG